MGGAEGFRAEGRRYRNQWPSICIIFRFLVFYPVLALWTSGTFSRWLFGPFFCTGQLLLKFPVCWQDQQGMLKEPLQRPPAAVYVWVPISWQVMIQSSRGAFSIYLLWPHHKQVGSQHVNHLNMLYFPSTELCTYQKFSKRPVGSLS